MVRHLTVITREERWVQEVLREAYLWVGLQDGETPTPLGLSVRDSPGRGRGLFVGHRERRVELLTGALVQYTGR